MVFTHFALIKDKITIGYINVKFLVEIQTKQKNVEDQKLEITTNDKFIINLLTKVDNLNDSIARKLPPIQKLSRKDLHDVQDHRKAQNSILLKYTEQRFQFENPQDDPSDPMQVLRSDVLRDTTVNNKKIIPNGNNLSVSMNPEVKAALQNESFTLDDIDHLKQAYSQDLFSFFTNILSGSLTSPLLISDTGFEMSPVQNNHKKNISKSNDGTIYYTYTCDYIRFNHNDSKADLIVNSRKIRFQCAVGYLYGPHEVKFKLTPSHNDQEKWVFELAEINTPNPIIYNIITGLNAIPLNSSGILHLAFTPLSIYH